MVNQAHISYPFLLALLLGTLFGYSFNTFELLVIILAAWAPDFDYIYFIIFNTGKPHEAKTHHYYITHAPLFYVPFLVILALFSWQLALLIFYGFLTHFIMDSLIASEGIRWLYPFKKDFYLWTSYTKGLYKMEDWLKAYKKMPIYFFDNIAFLVTVVLVFYIAFN